MTRIRTVKPELWRNARFCRVSLPARLLFVGTLNFADDWGRHPLDPMEIKLAVFPGDAVDVAQLAEELTAAGLWGVYTTDAGPFVQVLGFLRHQRVDRRQPARWPEPTPDNSDQDLPARWRLFFADLQALKVKMGIVDDSTPDSTNDRRTIDERSTNDPRTIDERSTNDPRTFDDRGEGKGEEGIEDQGRDQEEGGDAPFPPVLFPLGRIKETKLSNALLHDLHVAYGADETGRQLVKLAAWVRGSENGLRPENVEQWIRRKFEEDHRPPNSGGTRGRVAFQLDEKQILAAIAESDE